MDVNTQPLTDREASHALVIVMTSKVAVVYELRDSAKAQAQNRRTHLEVRRRVSQLAELVKVQTLLSFVLDLVVDHQQLNGHCYTAPSSYHQSVNITVTGSSWSGEYTGLTLPGDESVEFLLGELLGEDDTSVTDESGLTTGVLARSAHKHPNGHAPAPQQVPTQALPVHVETRYVSQPVISSAQQPAHASDGQAAALSQPDNLCEAEQAYVATDSQETEVTALSQSEEGFPSEPVAAAVFPNQQRLSYIELQTATPQDLGKNHRGVLQAAYAVEKNLLAGCGPEYTYSTPARLQQLLHAAAQDWPASGRPDASGAMVGGRVALKLEDIESRAPELRQAWQSLGSARVVAVSGPVVAVGTALGACLLVQLPHPTLSGPASAGLKPTATPAVSPVLQLGERRSEAEAVTALAFSVLTTPGDALWLAVAHASGSISVWDVQKKPAKQVASILQHGLPVTHLSFFPHRGTAQLLSVDRRGRCLLHTFTNMVLKTAVTSRLVIDSTHGHISSIQHLAAFMFPQPSTGDVARSSEPQDERARVGEGMVALCTASACHICRFKPSGELLSLYSLLPPAGHPAGTPPLAAWRPQQRHNVDIRQEGMVSVPCAELTVCWGSQLLFLQVPLLGDHQGPAITALAPTDAAPVRHRLYQAVSNRVNLVVTGSAGTAGSPVVEALTAAHVAELSATFPLTTTLSWSATVPGCVDQDQWAVGLHWYDGEALAVTLLQQLQTRILVFNRAMEILEQIDIFDTPYMSGLLPSRVASLPDVFASSGTRLLMLGASGLLHWCRLMGWQERLQTLVDAGKTKMALWLALEFFRKQQSGCTQDGMLEHWLLHLVLEVVSGTLAAAEQQQQQAAALAIGICLLINQPQVLWERVFPLFVSAGSAALACFLESLEPALLADVLRTPAPEVVQSLVELWAANGEHWRVERVVLHLDVFSLDLDQVLRLCEQHHLYSALTYICNRLGDYRRPLLDMLATAALVEDLQRRKAAGLKLLVYLSCVLHGQSFPPGSGPLAVAPACGAESLRAELLGLLLFLDTHDLAREWRRPLEAVQAKVVDPHPALQVLLSVDVGAAIEVLAAAVDGWDAVETDLRAAAGKPAEELQRVLVATQVLVNALVHLLEAAHQPAEPWAPSLDPAWQPVQDFVVKLLAAQRVTVPTAFALQLLRHIAAQAQSPKGNLPDLEQLFVRLVQAVGVSMPGQPPAADRFSQQECDAVLAAARRGGFASGAAVVHELRGDHASALRCQLDHSDPQTPFEYITKFLVDPGSTPSVRASLQAAVVNSIVALVTRDPAASVRLLLRHFPGATRDVLLQLQGHAEVQYHFLRAALQSTGTEYSHGIERQFSQNPMPALSPQAAELLQLPDTCNTYVQLLCQFEPDAVLPFLQQQHTYDVRACMRFCQEAGCVAAEAYLHERLGELPHALKLYLQEMDRCNSALIQAVQSAIIPVACTVNIFQETQQLQSSTASCQPTARLLSTEQLPEAQGKQVFAQESDIHLLWLATLSPRLALVLPRVAGPGVLVHKPDKSKYYASSANQASVPPQLTSAWETLTMAIAFCQRISRPSLRDRARHPQQWYQVVDRLVAQLQQLNMDTTSNIAESHVPIPAAGKRMLCHCFAAFLEEAVSCSVDHVPLHALVSHLMVQYGTQTFGQLRSTLLGLLSACAYEELIMNTAKRLISNDVFGRVRQVYRLRARQGQAVQEFPGSSIGYSSSSARAAGMTVSTYHSAPPFRWRQAAEQVLDSSGTSPQFSAAPAEHTVNSGLFTDASKIIRFKYRAVINASQTAVHLPEVRPDMPASTEGGVCTLEGAKLTPSENSFNVDDLLRWSKTVASGPV